MPLQRVGDAENPVRYKLSNGPRRAQSKVSNYLVFCDVRHTLVAVDMLVSNKCMGRTHECKVAPRIRKFIRP